MKQQNYIQRSKASFAMIVTSLALTTIMLSGSIRPAQAQTDVKTSAYTKPQWWIGAVGGANFNFYGGSTQQLNADLTVPKAFHKGNGIGLYLGPLVEYYRPGTTWGFMLQQGYDNRSGKFDKVTMPCNCPSDLLAKTTYFTVEPSVRFTPFKKRFFIYAGPRMAYNLRNSFTYRQERNPDFPNQAENPDMTGDFNKTKKFIFSMQVGIGYDIPLTSDLSRTQFVMTPFVAFHPSFGQAPRSVETWSITTLRTGIALKIGRGHRISPAEKENVAAVAIAPNGKLLVNAPKNIPVQRRVRETFPLRNYVFFNLGSTQIPDRYVMIKKDQVKAFNEDQLEVFKPKSLSGRSERQLIVYYNVLNIVGNRMQKNPTATIKLVGSSEKGQDDALAMAESIKKYLVDVFEINPSRITTEGLNEPKIPSGTPGGTQDLALLAEGNRRVSIESTTPGMLMEFQSGPDAPLKPVEIVDLQEAPFDSYVSFDVSGGDEKYSSWSMQIKDDKGKVQDFGPYTKEKLSLPGKTILGTRAEGDYKVSMTATTTTGKTVKKDTTVHMVLWTPAQNEEGMRFSVIYEYNESKAINMYDKYLTEIVTPKIPKGGTVIIHGHTDIIGDDAHNQALSDARAKDVKSILEKSLLRAGRTDVKFEVVGFGEDQNLTPFENRYPEERFYNRTVVIDIIPKR